MPARHISSQSFGDVLSDLGDDPAIADSHEIRKPPPQPITPPKAPNQSRGNLFTEPLNPLQIRNLLQGIALPITLITIFLAAAIAFFANYTSLNNESQNAWELSQRQISELKRRRYQCMIKFNRIKMIFIFQLIK